MSNIHLLIKKDKVQLGYNDVFPKTYIDAVSDKLTGAALREILASYNMYYVPYVGTQLDTRRSVPKVVRRKGLWLTYVTFDDKIVTVWYKGDNIEDVYWQDSNNWELSLTASGILDKYFSTDYFKNIFNQAIYDKLNEVIDYDKIAKMIEDYVNLIDVTSYIDTSVDSSVKLYLTSNDFAELVSLSINQYLTDTLSEEEIRDIILEYLSGLTFDEVLPDFINNWMLNNKEVIGEILTPIVDEKMDELREELQEWCNNTERVIANALIRHEQWILEHSN